jgi:hypothetical protein
MELGENNLCGRASFIGMDVGRYSSPVVYHGTTSVKVDEHVDVLAISGKAFIDAVVDDLIDKMVKALDARRADIHSRPFPYGIQALQHLDILGSVGFFIVFLFFHNLIF